MMQKKLPIFSSPEDREKYLTAYEAMFDLWRVPHEPVDVATRFGTTHINVSGPVDGHPLVLLHAAGFSSTAWFANVADLSARHRVYAVDIIGEAGKSTAERVMEDRIEYAEWLNDVFDGLKIVKGSLLGHSYGGWLTINMALVYPERLDKIILLAPAASLRPFSLLSQVGLRLAELNIRPPAESTLKMSAYKGFEFDEVFLQMMDMVAKYCVPSTMFPTVYTDEELIKIDMPVLLLIGAGEKIYNPKKAIERATRLMPGLSAGVVPEASHILIMEQPEIINDLVVKFLRGG